KAGCNYVQPARARPAANLRFSARYDTLSRKLPAASRTSIASPGPTSVSMGARAARRSNRDTNDTNASTTEPDHEEIPEMARRRPLPHRLRLQRRAGRGAGKHRGRGERDGEPAARRVDRTLRGRAGLRPDEPRAPE